MKTKACLFFLQLVAVRPQSCKAAIAATAWSGAGLSRARLPVTPTLRLRVAGLSLAGGRR